MTPDLPVPPDRLSDDSSEGLDPHPAASPIDGQGAEAPESVPCEEDESLADEAIPELDDGEVQNRLWIKALVPLLQLRSQETDPSGRVQLAIDLMYIAACERIARILRSDLPPDRG